MKAQDPLPLPLNTVLNAYLQGYFPMGDHDGDKTLNWYNPPQRAIMPIHDLHVSRKLRKLALRHPFEIRIDTAFAAVMEGCMENRPFQWITTDIRKIFNGLHQAGFAHSVECWQDNRLVGGLYGLALGSAFCAESMFSRAPGASKIALIHLCARLDLGGFTLMDCQILNDHTARFGAFEIRKTDYLNQLHQAVPLPGDFLLQHESPVISELRMIEDFLAH